MTASERRLLTITALAGTLLTAAVIVADVSGLFRNIEGILYDARATRCQHFLRPPTDRIVHIDIDDEALQKMGADETIGGWPWPRSVIAEMLDEIGQAGAKAIFLDIMFVEPQPPGHDAATGKPVYHDQRLSEAIARVGNAILPVSLEYAPRQRSEAFELVKSTLLKNLDMEQEDVLALLADQVKRRPELVREIPREYLAARDEVMTQRLLEEMMAGEMREQALRQKLLPGLEGASLRSPLLRLFSERCLTTRRIVEALRFGRPVPPGLPPVLTATGGIPPIRQVSSQAYYAGVADWLPHTDGFVRSVPLFTRYHDRLLPHVGLITACKLLDVDPTAIVLSPDAITIPRPGHGDIRIPVRTHAAPQGPVGLVMDIPWFGRDDWQTMYDWPEHKLQKNHTSIIGVWNICSLQRRYARNRDVGRNQVLVDAQKALDMTPTTQPATEEELDREMQQMAVRIDAARRDAPDDRRMAVIDAGLRQVLRQNEAFRQMLTEERQKLRASVEGKAVLLGWIATGAMDQVPTSVHAKCPGVVGHGAIINGILSGELWTMMPRWFTVLVTALVGLAITAAVIRLSPAKALLASAAIVGGYAVFNGLVLFDWGNHIAGLAGPLVCGGVVFTTLIVMRAVHELVQRSIITRRFSHYTDPALVRFLLDHPEHASMKAQVSELTVAFSDIVDFTRHTEALRERTVELLNAYMGRMVPLIRARNGLVNKFLGDGIMFFFGAPKENADHAADAVRAALDMHAALEQFNQEQAANQMPALAMRIGVSTGQMIVGDAGPDEGGDYTVLGDAVNLGARLEGANKAFGTRTLVSERTAQALGDGFLLRPIGRIRVVGRAEGVTVHEPLAIRDAATEQQRELARLTAAVVDAYRQARFSDCLSAIDALQSAFGPSRLCSIYRELCAKHSADDPASFTGVIELTEK